MEIKKERTIDGNTFFIRAFPAFAASNLSGELMALLTPVLGAIVPLVGGKSEDESIFDMDAEKAAPLLAQGLSGIDGDTVERMLKKLLIKHQNISVQLEGESDAVLLTEDLANDVFCGEAHELFILAFDVIQANFSGFFKKVAGAFGHLPKDLPAIAQIFQTTEH